MKSVREVMERVRATRVDEESARAAAARAKAEREAAERALGPAQREAQAISEATTRQARQRLKGLEQLVAQAKAMEAADHSLPQVALRVRARMLLTGGTQAEAATEPFSAAQALTSLATLDRVAGAWLNCSQTAGRLMQWLIDQDADEDGLMVEADRLECRGWSGFIRRVRHLAGQNQL